MISDAYFSGGGDSWLGIDGGCRGRVLYNGHTAHTGTYFLLQLLTAGGWFDETKLVAAQEVLLYVYM